MLEYRLQKRKIIRDKGSQRDREKISELFLIYREEEFMIKLDIGGQKISEEFI